MNQMLSTKTILYPTDFSRVSSDCLKSVTRELDIYSGNILLLHTFRLVDAGQSNLLGFKRDKEEEIIRSFKGFQQESEQHGFNYKLISEVGFLSARILYNLDNKDVNLLILTPVMQRKLRQPNEIGVEKLMERVPCPTLILPEIPY